MAGNLSEDFSGDWEEELKGAVSKKIFKGVTLYFDCQNSI